MEVLGLTIFISLLLAALFSLLFIMQRRQRRYNSLERESLLPLAEEKRVSAGKEAESREKTKERSIRGSERDR
ncbi:MAG: hypothetical protein JJU00_15060 [Opitutales bacterium]|nr:hypothetical protein [Opitutales bacterium]